MGNSFAKELVQLSAARLSKLLKESAKIIETVANVTDSEQFGVIESADSCVLTFNLKDLDPSEFEVSYNSQSVRLHIKPYCQDYLIPNIDRFSSFSALSTERRDKLANFAQVHQHVRWSTCTAEELHAFFSNWDFGVEGESGGQYPWQARAMAMLKPLIATAIRSRACPASLIKQSIPSIRHRSERPNGPSASAFRLGLRMIATRKRVGRCCCVTSKAC